MHFQGSEVRVLFLVHVPTHDPVAQCLALTGSHGAMGGWNTDRALVAEYVGAATWQVALYLPSDETFRWKWLMLSREAKEVLKQEDDPNRELTTLNDDISVECFWNGQEMITALYSESRRSARKYEKEALEQSPRRDACEGDGNIVKKSHGTLRNKNNSFYILHGSESDKHQTRKSRSVSHLRVRFADEIPDKSYGVKQMRSLSSCFQQSKRRLARTLYPGKTNTLERTKNAVTNWKTITDYGIPLGIVTGAAALGVFICRKWL